MRLIDADKIEPTEIYNGEWVRVAYIDDIDELPTIDAEPVRHGRWIKVEDDYNNCLYECSYCHTWTSLPTEEDSDGHIRYCWSCGAKMDGERREDVRSNDR